MSVDMVITATTLPKSSRMGVVFTSTDTARPSRQ